jgi:hypothetical protein
VRGGQSQVVHNGGMSTTVHIKQQSKRTGQQLLGVQSDGCLEDHRGVLKVSALELWAIRLQPCAQPCVSINVLSTLF